MKIELIFGRTETDNVEMTWTGIRKAVVEIPDDLPVTYNQSNPYAQYHLIGMTNVEEAQP